MNRSCETPSSRGTGRHCQAMSAHARPLPSPGNPGLTPSSVCHPPGNTSRREKVRGTGGLASAAGGRAGPGPKRPLRELRAGEAEWGRLTRGGSSRSALLTSLSPDAAQMVSHRLSFDTAQTRTGVKSHKNGAGRSSFAPLAALSAAVRRARSTPDSQCSRGEATVGWTLLLLPPPPWLRSGPVSSSRLVLGAARSGPAASSAQPSGTPRRLLCFPCLPSARLQRGGAAPAAPENQDDHSGILQPHQLGSD